MGNFLEKPVTDKRNFHGEGNSLRYGVGSMQGWRTEMEDAHFSKIGLGEGYENWSFFGIFDGHGGSTVSHYCAENLLKCIMATSEFSEGAIREAIIAGFQNLDSDLLKKPEFSSGEDKAGSTAICALINSTNIYIANLGDSRGILSKTSAQCFSTVDHKPINPPERERILSAGGTVVLQRLNGSLAVSRAVGDYQYKGDSKRPPARQLVSIEPDVYVLERDEENDEFLVLACDGIWDVMLNEDVCDYVRYLLSITSDLEYVVNHLIDTCLFKKSFDNMSVILITLAKAPKPSLSIIKRDESVNRKVGNLVRGIIGNHCDVDFKVILNVLEEEDIQDLPPGAGLSAKMSLVQQIYQELCPHEADKNFYIYRWNSIWHSVKFNGTTSCV
ncbi:protein phosphatase 1B-like [Cimex lectularius]|uniref:PPM-type phosphatase domain-containing protein n=1 Tax=Cimex lectularius TaxID=79782 RepID=A0A8I6RI56_CIMLE|nr:protein phosphatase 1B-like [Cimex lectularius]